MFSNPGNASIEALFVCKGCVLTKLAKCSKPCQELVQISQEEVEGCPYAGMACALVKTSSGNV